MSTTLKESIFRKKQANNVINKRMLYAAGLGLIPLPIIDAASILTTQVLMVQEIAEVYRIPCLLYTSDAADE